ncbi:hypothetical protein HK103_004977 [Boothiomyces macroporosus]|uniref:D-xylose 1-dehydrogenase (NADP(+), D-xylono-1,5-lactone-forming) n=1 Tax=Boothiomyces macroporosus TaxID=261099 RepID=A0AAD5UIL8_9FUNG|nr:hypothetical protein HK103_004977 [Boothiomyces macroporosus]
MSFFSRLYSTFVSGSTPKDENAIRIGILGAANIVPIACTIPLSRLSTGVAYAVAARSKEKATEFAKKNGILHVLDSYDDILNDENVDAVYIPLPNSLHHVWAIKAIEKGKHVLCEKPLTDNAEQARQIADALEKHNSQHEKKVVFAEAFHWKCHPLARFLSKLVQGNIENMQLGEIKEVNTVFRLPGYVFKKDDIRYNFSLGGGATMDTGCYALSASRFVVQSALKSTNIAPTVITSEMKSLEADKNIDVSLVAELEYPSGIKSKVQAGFDLGMLEGIIDSRIEIIGSLGSVKVSNFIAPYAYHSVDFKGNNGKSACEKVYDEGHSTYYYQMRSFLDVLHGRISEFSTVGLTDIYDSIENMKVIDAMYEKAGFLKRP